MTKKNKSFCQVISFILLTTIIAGEREGERDREKEREEEER